ncbi:MAG TPA: response regulator [Caulobacteraceae bacterium]|jgi:CheY-like chemotaxis protein|nr:response regulator [Caulobacteraceae bacterium]
MTVVLVVDDEMGVANLLSDVLSDEGYHVIVAPNGREALRRAGEQHPDLVISDLMMPVMDGAQLKKAMEAEPDLKDIPFIIMSSMPEATVLEQCAGYALFVRKPFQIYGLIDQIKNIVDSNSSA